MDSLRHIDDGVSVGRTGSNKSTKSQISTCRWYRLRGQVTLKLDNSYGYSKIQSGTAQDLRRSLTGEDITEWSDWGQFQVSIANRNAIIHNGKESSQEESQNCLELAACFIQH